MTTSETLPRAEGGSVTLGDALDVQEATERYSAVPGEMKVLRNWVLWKYELVENAQGGRRKTKIPYQVNGKKADSTDPETWGTLEECLGEMSVEGRAYDGLGFVFSEDSGLMGVDFDHIKDENGEWNPEALEEILSLKSYAEISPSGEGAHVICIAEIPGDRRRKGLREMYESGRYFTVTGDHIEGSPKKINLAQRGVNALYNKWFEPVKETPKPGTLNLEKGSSKALPDSEIIDLCRKAKNSGTFESLYSGSWEGSYPSQSEADQALCDILAFYTQDPKQIESIFSSSGLYREKWARVDYRNRTIGNAISGVSETYTPGKWQSDSRKAAGKNEPESEPENEGKSQQDRVNEYPEDVRKWAHQILKEGDAFDFIMETWNQRHIGDKVLGRNCLCAVASTYIVNSEMGLHIKPSGNSGKGKSSGAESFLQLLPPHKYITGSLSGKTVFYNPHLKAGTIIYSDDAHLNDDLIATVKQSTSKFQEPTLHHTVKRQEYLPLKVPERVSWWFSFVDGFDDEQMANRFLTTDVDGSTAQDERVLAHNKNLEILDYSPDDPDVQVCRCIFDILGMELYRIKIPYASVIEWRNPENRRNFPKFLGVIRAVTLFNVFQREQVEGVYLATYEDYERALKVYSGTAKNNATNLTDQEILVLRFIAERNTYDGDGLPVKIGETTISDLISKLDVSRTRVRHILHGKDGNGGMLAKVKLLDEADQSDSETTVENEKQKTKTTRAKKYVYRGKRPGLEIYDCVAELDRGKAERATEKFKKVLVGELSVTSITLMLPDCYPTEVIEKTRMEERIKNNVTKKKESYIDGVGATNLSPNCEGNILLSQNMGNRVTLEGDSSQDSVLTATIEGNSRVTGGNQGCTKVKSRSSSLKIDNRDGFNLLRRDLINFAKTHYNSIVEDLDKFVDEFIKKYPGYGQTNSRRNIKELAGMLDHRGWK